MGKQDFSFDSERAVDRLLRFLAIEGITGHEKAIAQAVIHDLVHAGVPRRAIQFDDASARIPLPTETGNLIVNLAGTRAGPRRLFMTHLDTVPLCAAQRRFAGDNASSPPARPRWAAITAPAWRAS